MKSLRDASERLERLYALELCHFALRPDSLRHLLWAAVALCLASLAGSLGAMVHGLLGLVTLGSLLVLPPLYAGLSVWWEWAGGTAVWWVALPDAPWLRLAAKALRGAVLGWAVALVGGLVYLVQFALRAALHSLAFGGVQGGVLALAHGTRWALAAALLAVPLALGGTALGAWAVRLRGRAAGWLLWAPSATVVLGGLAVAAIGAGDAVPVGWEVGATLAALLFWWACRWLGGAPQVSGAGRG